MRFLFFLNIKKNIAIEKAKFAINFLIKSGCECAILKSQCRFFSNLNIILDSADNLSNYDVIISIGGDGTIISAAKMTLRCANGPPILGINAGNTGFLCGIDKNQDLNILKKILEKKYIIRSSMVLKILDGNVAKVAINDVLLTKASLNGILNLRIFEKREKINKVNEYMSDSILFSTPIGSTAYALSNGGPIVDPKLKFISMTPIRPHSLISRTLLFSYDSELIIENGIKDFAFIILDGIKNRLLKNGERIKLMKHEQNLKLIYLDNMQFFQKVKDKLINFD